MSLELKTVTGAQLAPWIDAVARLRISVFRHYPYLYDGSFEYERNYLSTYLKTESSVCVLVLDGDSVVGASTGLSLADETEEFRSPFVAAGLNPDEIFYCAESVLLPEYHGQGVYRHFFTEREAQAKRLGKTLSVFCAVERPDDHPLKPEDYMPLNSVWQHFGYTPLAGVKARFSWKDVDQPAETDKLLQFFSKSLTL